MVTLELENSTEWNTMYIALSKCDWLTVELFKYLAIFRSLILFTVNNSRHHEY